MLLDLRVSRVGRVIRKQSNIPVESKALKTGKESNIYLKDGHAPKCLASPRFRH